MAELHAYQRRAAQHLLDNPAAALWLDVGLGKSAATLTALKSMIESGEVFSALVIAPKVVAEETWPSERDLWATELSISMVVGTPRERMRAVMSPAPIHIIGIDNVPWLVETFGAKWPYETIVLDESQRFKDQGSKRFRSLRKVRKHFSRVILLSATPASESLLGLWAQVFLADGGERLGKTFTAYRDAFFAGDYMGWRYDIRPGAERLIHERIGDMVLSMRADDYLDLPDRIDNRIEVRMGSAAQAAYAALERDYLMRYRGEVVTAANAAVLAGKLLQLTSGQVYDEEKNIVEVHQGKITALEELVDAMNGNPLLVFYAFRHEADLIEARIKGAEPLNVVKWERGEQRVAFAHPKSAGAGLNLQHGGATMCWYSLPWSLDLYIQSCGRLHRQGQRRTVVIHHLLVPGSIDEDVMTALAAKKDGQERLLNALKGRINRDL